MHVERRSFDAQNINFCPPKHKLSVGKTPTFGGQKARFWQARPYFFNCKRQKKEGQPMVAPPFLVDFLRRIHENPYKILWCFFLTKRRMPSKVEEGIRLCRQEGYGWKISFRYSTFRPKLYRTSRTFVASRLRSMTSQPHHPISSSTRLMAGRSISGSSRRFTPSVLEA